MKSSKKKLRCNVTSTGAIYTAAVLEYVSAEVLELSGNACIDTKLTRITPRHIGLAIRGDEELDILLPGVIAGAGIIPHIHKSLVSKIGGLKLVLNDDESENEKETLDNNEGIAFGNNDNSQFGATGGFSFGGTTAPVNQTGFSFGGNTSMNQTGFSFGSITTPEFTFGSTANQGGFMFG